jgi:hypothetical protein
MVTEKGGIYYCQHLSCDYKSFFECLECLIDHDEKQIVLESVSRDARQFLRPFKVISFFNFPVEKSFYFLSNNSFSVSLTKSNINNILIYLSQNHGFSLCTHCSIINNNKILLGYYDVSDGTILCSPFVPKSQMIELESRLAIKFDLCS